MTRKAAEPLQNSASGNHGEMDRRKFVHGLGLGALASLPPASLGTFARRMCGRFSEALLASGISIDFRGGEHP